MSTRPFTLDRYAALHQQPTGPGDGRPTAMQIVHANQLEDKLSDKVMLVTGASTGIGVDTAIALAATGARIFLGVRDLDKGEALITKIESALPGAKGRLELIYMDLASLPSIRTAAQTVMSKTSVLNVLVNNAGIALAAKSTTPDGFDNMFQVNYLAHFLLFQLLKPLLLKSSLPKFHSRVVNVSSLTHRYGTVDFADLNWTSREYSRVGNYASSKTAVIWMANEIERRYGGQGLHGYSLNPGMVLGTNAASSYDAETAKFMDSIMEVEEVKKMWKSNEQGAATTVVGAVEKSLEGRGGIYLEDCGTSKLWDEKVNKGTDPGFEKWCFNEEGAKKLWEVACGLVNVDAQ